MDPKVIFIKLNKNKGVDKMKCDLLCTYNKRSKVFDWSDNNTDIVDIDELVQMIINYVKANEKRTIIISGYDACCEYIDNLKENIDIDDNIDKNLISPFWIFKTHVRGLVKDIFSNQYVVAPISLCNDFFNAYNACEKAYNDENTKLIDFLNFIDELHLQERDIFAKIYGLRVIKNVR